MIITEKSLVNQPNKILGVLGGMGPAATVEFMNILVTKYPANCDQEYPKIFLLMNPQIPDRNKALFENGENPTPYLKEGLFTLKKWGADFLAVPCNAAHYFIDSFLDELDIPFIHIIKHTILKAKNISPNGAWIISTLATRKTDLYEKYARKEGYELFYPTWEFLEEIQEAVDMVKAGKLKESGKRIKPLLKSLWEERKVPIIAGCTELPLAYKEANLPKELIISSLEALADGCINFWLN
ncbi:MAG TPA: amino acid racemase [Defluviitoga sp.]|nr:amino acid racemase [Defluviitoga sp.]HPZ29125.1 amino acid racemase [Defluviitoga sp.]HQD63055.1 amino acid racemase [Defluviitoga sp.]